MFGTVNRGLLLHIFRLSNVIRIALFVLLTGVAVSAEPGNIEETAKLLPDHLGAFKAITQARPFDDDADFFNGTAMFYAITRHPASV